jgi:hypothetical protein
MWQSWTKVALAAKSLVELTVACEVAVAGQIIMGVCVALVGIAPHVWSFSRRFVDGQLNESDFSAGPFPEDLRVR